MFVKGFIMNLDKYDFLSHKRVIGDILEDRIKFIAFLSKEE